MKEPDLPTEYCPCGYWAALETLPASDEKHWIRYCRGCDTFLTVKQSPSGPPFTARVTPPARYFLLLPLNVQDALTNLTDILYASDDCTDLQELAARAYIFGKSGEPPA